MSDNSCFGCDCYDPDMGCAMSSIDKSYACSQEESTEEEFHVSDSEY